jgi:hypothetical protein
LDLYLNRILALLLALVQYIIGVLASFLKYYCSRALLRIKTFPKLVQDNGYAQQKSDKFVISCLNCYNGIK